MNPKGSGLRGPATGGILLEKTEPQCGVGASHSSLCCERGAGTGHPKGPDTFILNWVMAVSARKATNTVGQCPLPGAVDTRGART